MKRILIFYLILCMPVLAFAQEEEWIPGMTEQGANFYHIRKRIVEKNEVALSALSNKRLQQDQRVEPDKESGYDLIKFRRWEWYWSSRVNTDGSFPSARQINSAFSDFNRSNNSQARVSAAAAANWVNISRTSNSGGYWGMGRASSIGFHPTQSNTFWVTAPNGGVWKTTNGGINYTPMGDNLPYLGAGSIVVDYANPNNIYVATGDHTGGNSLGIYKSTDGGVTWAPTGLSNNLDGQVVFYNLVQSSLSSTTLFAASNRGLYRTTDGGNTWSLIRSGRCTDVEIKVNDGNIVYAAIGNVIYRSMDGGSNFNQVLSAGSGTARIVITRADVNRILVWSNNGIWLSTDGGTNWSVKSWPVDGGNIIPWSMVISPNNGNILYAGQVDIYRSDNAGASWTKIGRWCCGTPAMPEVHADHRNLTYSGLTGEVYSLNDGGVDRYNEVNRTWARLSNGLVIPQYYSAASSATNASIIGVGSQDNGGSRRETDLLWYNSNGGDAGTQAIDPTNASIRYSNYNPSPAIIRTTNGWGSTTDVRPSGTLASWWTIPYTLDPNNSSNIVVGYHAIYKSTNRGDTWSKISPDFTTAGDYWGAVRSIAMAPSNSNYIYATRPRTIYYTANGGSTWNNYTFNFADLTNVCVKQNDPRTIWVTFGQFSAGNKVYRSTDGGASWVNYSEGLPNIPTNDIIYQNGSNDLLYLATDFGVFYRDAGMTSWVKYGNDLPVCPVTDLHIQYSSGKLRAATYARGIYETDILNGTLACAAPANVRPISVTASSATIAWSPIGQASDYYIYYIKQGDASWTSGPTGLTSPQATLTGLTAGATYDADVWVHCSTDEYFSSRISFTTTATPVPGITDVPNKVKGNEIRIYPTRVPKKGSLGIDLTELLNSKHQLFLSVFDIHGRLLHNRQIPSGFNTLTLDRLNIMNSGIYLIRIIEGSNAVTRKIVVTD